MSTLAYSHVQPSAVEVAGADHAEAAPRRGFWQRFLDALIASRQRQADREIAYYLARRGGVFTDDVEREVMQRLSGRRSL
jgi:hypothetical protein